MNDSTFKNVDYNVVRIHFHSSGTENMRLNQGQSDVLRGPDGESYYYAWKARDEMITEEEFESYKATGVFGRNYSFGNPEGQVP